MKSALLLPLFIAAAATAGSALALQASLLPTDGAPAAKRGLVINAKGRLTAAADTGSTAIDTLSEVFASDRGLQNLPARGSVSMGRDSSGSQVLAMAVGDAGTHGAPSTGTQRPVASSLATEPVITPAADAVVSGPLTAFHRSGQTFLTWQETAPDDSYHVYRHTELITPANLASAERLTGRWGPLGNNTSVNVYGGEHVPANFVINDLAAPLGDDTGLFVYTTQAGDSAGAFYAVTNVRDGKQKSLMRMTTPVSESVAPPSDVLTTVTNSGSGRIYTQFMDYINWNPTLNGYAYNYAVALPANYDPKIKYPLMIELHAYSEKHKFMPEAQYGWQVIQLFPSDPGASLRTKNTWWYGYSNSHDYRNVNAVPKTGPIENFTEQRVMRAIDRVVDAVSVDPNLIYGSGNSMGASGLVALAMRYGSVISGVYANEPMTDYAAGTRFAEALDRLWGAKSLNLPVVNRGPHSESIASVNVGVWDWMNHHKQLVARRGTDMGYLMTLHGKLDNVIEWQTQGKPFVEALTAGSAGYSAIYDEVGHTWVGFSSPVKSLFGFGPGENFPYKYPLNMSFPSIQNASGSSSITPADVGKDRYNMDIEWATPHTRFAAPIVDKPARYEISIRSNAGRQTADITPRRAQLFKLRPGQQCQYQAVDSGGGALGSGNVTADSDALVTIKSMPILTGVGTRLTINCP